MSALSDVLSKAKEDRGLTNATLAPKLNMNRNKVGAILNGVTTPSSVELEAFSRVLELDHQVLLELVGRPNYTFPEYFADSASFYVNLRRALMAATGKARTSYIRVNPPDHNSQDPEAAAYFKSLLEWSNQPGNSVSRIIAVPLDDDGFANREFLAYLEKHCEETRDYPRYHFKVISHVGRQDNINMAIFENSMTLLTTSGLFEEGRAGVTVPDGNTVSVLSTWFDTTWFAAESPDVYLRRAQQKVEQAEELRTEHQRLKDEVARLIAENQRLYAENQKLMRGRRK